MNRPELKLLERAFSAEIESALNGGPNVFQTKSKLAEGLADDGYLERRSELVGEGFFAVRVTGYGLTHLGRLSYCMSCEGEA